MSEKNIFVISPVIKPSQKQIDDCINEVSMEYENSNIKYCIVTNTPPEDCLMDSVWVLGSELQHMAESGVDMVYFSHGWTKSPTAFVEHRICEKLDNINVVGSKF